MSDDGMLPLIIVGGIIAYFVFKNKNIAATTTNANTGNNTNSNTNSNNIVTITGTIRANPNQPSSIPNNEPNGLPAYNPTADQLVNGAIYIYDGVKFKYLGLDTSNTAGYSGPFYRYGASVNQMVPVTGFIASQPTAANEFASSTEVVHPSASRLQDGAYYKFINKQWIFIAPDANFSTAYNPPFYKYSQSLDQMMYAF